ncbi:Alpha/Beta hydrolase protein [Plectosphaerella cucumerina]|uniref:Carboxylic ester hydrolase n=1 Tax=Plectosphaerella cucumerina TaxID=40658 RepID=A0A8K0X0Q8_9PEZI|nr:Alpha/Beta hydrolase protein [Plectosphaerella cucumerina]
MAVLSIGATFAAPQHIPPSVQVKNGTYQGRYVDQYDQDIFLGIAFAQPPLGDLRFRNPQPLNSTWDGIRSAEEFAGECTAYPQSFKANYTEDCLYLNVWRPANEPRETSLPVLVWVHGGGFNMGSTSNPRFDMSWMVERSVKMGQPIIGVSINYRLNAFGFLSSDEVRASSHSNFGIRDQRLALHWIQENIDAFGGDPTKVTIFGESAGAASVGLHLTAYNGRDDGLFRHAIMQSGNPIFYRAINDTALHQRRYDALVAATDCGNAAMSTLECLRGIPYESLDALLLKRPDLVGNWVPQMDGDLIARHTSQKVAAGDFVKVPVIIGANSEEGTAFGARGIDSSEDFLANLVQNKVPPGVAAELVEIYSNDSPDQVLSNIPPGTPFPDAYGHDFRRVATYAGDQMFIAHRRASCEAWATSGTPAFCYRFNAIPMNHGTQRSWMGSTHFVEVAFVFLNLEGRGYVDFDPPQGVFDGLSESYKDLARLISSDWIAFTNHGDPNRWAGRQAAAVTLGMAVPSWPRYRVSGEKCGRVPEVFLFEGDVTSRVEADTYRKDGIDLINSVDIAVFDR